MNNVKLALTTGATVELDGNLNALIETIYDEIYVKNNYRSGFNDLASEISFVISQMPSEVKDRYLFICLGVLIDRFHREVYEELSEEKRL